MHHPPDTSPDRSLAFPIRLKRGLFATTSEREAYLTLIGIMARTPRGSWPGHEQFGFNEFFLNRGAHTAEQRAKIADATVAEINAVLADLGLAQYRVESLTIDPVENINPFGDLRHATYAQSERGATIVLRETASNRTVRHTV